MPYLAARNIVDTCTTLAMFRRDCEPPSCPAQWEDRAVIVDLLIHLAHNIGADNERNNERLICAATGLTMG